MLCDGFGTWGRLRSGGIERASKATPCRCVLLPGAGMPHQVADRYFQVSGFLQLLVFGLNNGGCSGDRVVGHDSQTA